MTKPVVRRRTISTIAVAGKYSPELSRGARLPPGSTSLRYTWTSPYAADADATGGAYRLTVQKQPGLLPSPLTLTIQVPEGHRITAASPELVVNGAEATLSTTFDRDIVIGVQYAP